MKKTYTVVKKKNKLKERKEIPSATTDFTTITAATFMRSTLLSSNQFQGRLFPRGRRNVGVPLHAVFSDAHRRRVLIPELANDAEGFPDV